MYRKNSKDIKVETTEEFLARGGQIGKCPPVQTNGKLTKREKDIDVQALIDSCTTEDELKGAVQYLKDNGIAVEFE
jgi:hypothetical protein